MNHSQKDKALSRSLNRGRNRRRKSSKGAGKGKVSFIPIECLLDPSLGSRIRANRLKYGMSQEKLAKHINMSQSEISRMERDPAQFRLRDIVTVCQTLNIDLNDLIEGISVEVTPKQALQRNQDSDLEPSYFDKQLVAIENP